VFKQAFTLFAFGLGSSLALSSASCGPTCPPGEQHCGNSNPGAAGAAGRDSDAGTSGCALLTAMQRCMTAYCARASNPFCTCYKRGFDLTTAGCVCIDFDAELFCDNYKNVNAATYDCAAASSAVSSTCIGVK
jgi:hypothetical protein